MERSDQLLQQQPQTTASFFLLPIMFSTLVAEAYKRGLIAASELYRGGLYKSGPNKLQGNIPLEQTTTFARVKHLD